MGSLTARQACRIGQVVAIDGPAALWARILSCDGPLGSDARVQAVAVLKFEGGCHCRALVFVYCTSLPVEQWSVRACQCRFCLAHGALTTSDPAGSLELIARDPDALLRYRFGLGTADFLICSRCGVYIGAQMRTEEGAFGICNVRAMLPIPTGVPSPLAMDYGSENVPERQARRTRRWTPCR